MRLGRSRSLAVVAAIALVALVVASLVLAWPALRARRGWVDVDADDALVRDVVAKIADDVQRNILVDESVGDARVTTRLRRERWRDALDTICRLSRCEIEERGTILVVTRPVFIDVKAEDQPLVSVVESIASRAKKSVIVVPDMATKRVTLDLRDVHWLKALHAIVRTCDGEVIEDSAFMLHVVSKASLVRPLAPVRFVQQDVRRALVEAAARDGTAIVIDDDVQGTVTVDYAGPRAVLAVTNAAGLVAIVGSASVHVVTPRTIEAFERSR